MSSFAFRRCVLIPQKSTRLKTVVSVAQHKSTSPFNIPDFEQPNVKTAIPGPNGKNLLRETDKIQVNGGGVVRSYELLAGVARKAPIGNVRVEDIGSAAYARFIQRNTAAMQFFCNYEKSKGNFVVDADDNVLLDCFQQVASLPLGYNHPELLKLSAEHSSLMTLVNRPALGSFPAQNFPQLLRDSLLRAAPPNFQEVLTMACGSCSNENAFKTAFFSHMKRRRGEELPPTGSTEYITCMQNQDPGSPNIAILSFTNGFHGRTMGALSTTHCRPIHKLDVPAYPWPTAPFPRLQYPLEDYQRENEEEEAQCLEIIEEIIVTWKVPIAGLIIEPIQSEGGDNHASDEFFRKLIQIANSHNIVFICDEVQTGLGMSGKMWAHEYWDVDNGPDIVTFAKKMLTAGFYYKSNLRWTSAYRIYNTWMGDPIKLVLLSKVLQIIHEQSILEKIPNTGNYLLSGLIELEKRYPHFLSASRGRGLLCAFDVPLGKREIFVKKLLQNGVLVGICGKNSIRLRPSLLFTSKHADIVLDKLEATAKWITS